MQVRKGARTHEGAEDMRRLSQNCGWLSVLLQIADTMHAAINETWRQIGVIPVVVPPCAR